MGITGWLVPDATDAIGRPDEFAGPGMTPYPMGPVGPMPSDDFGLTTPAAQSPVEAVLGVADADARRMFGAAPPVAPGAPAWAPRPGENYPAGSGVESFYDPTRDPRVAGSVHSGIGGVRGAGPEVAPFVDEFAGPGVRPPRADAGLPDPDAPGPDAPGGGGPGGLLRAAASGSPVTEAGTRYATALDKMLDIVRRGPEAVEPSKMRSPAMQAFLADLTATMGATGSRGQRNATGMAAGLAAYAAQEDRIAQRQRAEQQRVQSEYDRAVARAKSEADIELAKDAYARRLRGVSLAASQAARELAGRKAMAAEMMALSTAYAAQAKAGGPDAQRLEAAALKVRAAAIAVMSGRGTSEVKQLMDFDPYSDESGLGLPGAAPRTPAQGDAVVGGLAGEG